MIFAVFDMSSLTLCINCSILHLLHQTNIHTTLNTSWFSQTYFWIKYSI